MGTPKLDALAILDSFSPHTLTGAKAAALPFLRLFFQFVDALWSPRSERMSNKNNRYL